MQVQETVNLPLVIKDFQNRDYETQQIESNGHYFIYCYIAETGTFLWAKLPSEATAPIFKTLSNEDTVPVGGWIAV
jgi:hypothetical protein